MRKLVTYKAAILAATVTFSGATAAGLQAELRSAAAVLPGNIPGAVAPTAPAGGVAVGAQAWACDARQGFAPIVAVENGVLDPLLAIGTNGGVKLPISPTTVPATCGQGASQGSTVYITQGVVDTQQTRRRAACCARCLIRIRAC